MLSGLLLLILWMMCGLAFACFFSVTLGWGLYGGIPGFVFGFLLAIPGTGYLLDYPRMVLYPLPPCRKGKCQGYDQYSIRVGSFNGGEGWNSYYYRCQCEDVYVRRGRRFMEVSRDGTTRPYKRLVGFQTRTWITDEARETASLRSIRLFRG